MYKVQIQYEHFLKKIAQVDTYIWHESYFFTLCDLFEISTFQRRCEKYVATYYNVLVGWNVLLLSTYYESFISFFLFIFQSKNYLLKLGQFHRHVGVPSDYLGVMGSIFVHAVKPYLENHNQWNEKIEDAWMELFSHIARVMRHGHIHYFSEPTGRELTSTQSVSL